MWWAANTDTCSMSLVIRLVCCMLRCMIGENHMNQIVEIVWILLQSWLGCWQLYTKFLILWGRQTEGSSFSFLFLEKSLNQVSDWPCLAMSKLLGMFMAGSNNLSFLLQKVPFFKWNWTLSMKLDFACSTFFLTSRTGPFNILSSFSLFVFKNSFSRK